MARELMRYDRSDLLQLGLFCAGLVLDTEVDKHWLTERFGTMESILEDSWVYQEVIAKGEARGMERCLQQGLQTARQGAIGIVVARFSALEQLAQEIIETISDANRLQTLIVELSVVSTQEQAKELLFSLVSGE